MERTTRCTSCCATPSKSPAGEGGASSEFYGVHSIAKFEGNIYTPPGTAMQGRRVHKLDRGGPVTKLDRGASAARKQRRRRREPAERQRQFAREAGSPTRQPRWGAG
jgi:hypothetical protein